MTAEPWLVSGQTALAAGIREGTGAGGQEQRTHWPLPITRGSSRAAPSWYWKRSCSASQRAEQAASGLRCLWLFGAHVLTATVVRVEVWCEGTNMLARQAAFIGAGMLLLAVVTGASHGEESQLGIGAGPGRVAGAAIAVVAAAVYLWVAIRRAPYTGAWGFGPAIEPVPPGSATRAIVRLALLAAVALLLSWQVAVAPGSPVRGAAPPEHVVVPPVSGPALPSTIIVVASIGAVLIMVTLSVAAIMGRRRRRRAGRGLDPSTPVTPPTPIELADAAMEALREQSDPRLAILAAYARMERLLAGRGLPRSPHETPAEYAGRLLTASGAPAQPVGTLTSLFQLAGFSRRRIGERMRDDAIAAVAQIAEASS